MRRLYCAKNADRERPAQGGLAVGALTALGDRDGAVRDGRTPCQEALRPMSGSQMRCSLIWRPLAAPSPETIFDRRVQPEKRLLGCTGGVQESNQQPPKTLQHHLERDRDGQ
jgi:hypothetical protein